MAAEYCVEVCRKLEEKILAAKLYRPRRIARYDAGDELVYEVTGVEQPNKGRVHLIVEEFVGGGFAGQVYRVRVTDTETEDVRLSGIEAGGVYAMKILIPPSAKARIFRNLLYRIGFQGPFQLQANPTATRSGALWQKFIRRGAKIRLGDESAVADIYATFVDKALGSCGELSEWVDGRTWRLEVDDRLDYLKRYLSKKDIDPQKLSSPEYLAKREFMTNFVKLLHELGADEFARQYEWSTCKSQPNCLKRKDTDQDPSGGLVAVDFRAGLALLPFLPMSPGDFELIVRGIQRGSLVQFDRGDTKKLTAFVEANRDDFADMMEMLDELKAAEKVYRNSVPDITHNHLRLFYQQQLWSTMLDSAVTGWKVRNIVDQRSEQRLRNNKTLTMAFFIIGAIPFLGGFLRKIWARPDWRKHYAAILTSRDYLQRTVRARIAEKVIIWHRASRIDSENAIKVSESFWLFLRHLPLSVLPAALHRFLTDRQYAKERLAYIFVRPVRLYFNADMRELWLREMLADGRKKHILTDEDAETILSQLNERYIQRYLISLVVHLLTLPVTQIVSIIVAWIYYQKTGSKIGAGGILVLFQIIPISPGSICRGIWAVGIAIYDRDFKNYNIAVFLSFFKYIGYLAFPIQMTYHYPALARFMAAHWSTEGVHIVPVFGERGALLEHWVFRLFYNWPLTIRRRMRKRFELRRSMKPRYWQIGPVAAGGAMIFGLADLAYLGNLQTLPGGWEIWWLWLVVPFVCSAAVTLGCGGAVFWKRLTAAAFCGILLGLLYTVVSATLSGSAAMAGGGLAQSCVWRVFDFAIFSSVGAIIAELKLPDADLS